MTSSSCPRARPLARAGAGRRCGRQRRGRRRGRQQRRERGWERPALAERAEGEAPGTDAGASGAGGGASPSRGGAGGNSNTGAGGRAATQARAGAPRRRPGAHRARLPAARARRGTSARAGRGDGPRRPGELGRLFDARRAGGRPRRRCARAHVLRARSPPSLKTCLRRSASAPWAAHRPVTASLVADDLDLADLPPVGARRADLRDLDGADRALPRRRSSSR